jgi:hypothetical protein
MSNCRFSNGLGQYNLSVNTYLLCFAYGFSAPRYQLKLVGMKGANRIGGNAAIDTFSSTYHSQ